MYNTGIRRLIGALFFSTDCKCTNNFPYVQEKHEKNNKNNEKSRKNAIICVFYFVFEY